MLKTAPLMIVVCAATCLLAQSPTAQPRFSLLSSFQTGVFNQGAAEIVAYDKESKRLFVVNFSLPGLEVLDVSNPASPGRTTRFFAPEGFGSSPNSVAIRNGVVAVAFEASPKTDPGSVVFYNAEGRVLSAIKVGAQPDMVTFTPDGSKVLTANEGEPNDSYSIDPEGSVSIIDLSRGAQSVTQESVSTVGFSKFNGQQLNPSIRVYGPRATVAQDFEPEYIAVSPDSRLAYVTVQEANTIAVIDLSSREVVRLIPLGFKDHSKTGNGLDVSDRDNKIDIRNWPVLGLYQPDGIAAFQHDGKTYLITANEGDARAWAGFAEEDRVGNLNLDATVFPNATELKRNENLGRLTVSRAGADIDGDGDIDRLYVPGARSFSIISADDGTLVFESGDLLERLMAERFPRDFNSDAAGGLDTRSDNKGPEPEGVVVAELAGKRYALIALERMSGIAVFDISDPSKPSFVDYVHNRNFEGDASRGTGGDHGPEGLIFIPAADGPSGEALLVVANEVSGSTTLYSVTPPPAGLQAKLTPASLSTVNPEVLLNASESTGDIASYSWRVLGGRSAGLILRDNGRSVSVQFGQGFGEYEIELTVTGTDGSSSVTTSKLFYTGR